MPKIISRIVAVLLVPCLSADPGHCPVASISSSLAPTGGESVTQGFTSQALAPEPVTVYSFTNASEEFAQSAADVARQTGGAAPAGRTGPVEIAPEQLHEGWHARVTRTVVEFFQSSLGSSMLPRLDSLINILDRQAEDLGPGRPEVENQTVSVSEYISGVMDDAFLGRARWHGMRLSGSYMVGGALTGLGFLLHSDVLLTMGGWASPILYLVLDLLFGQTPINWDQSTGAAVFLTFPASFMTVASMGDGPVFLVWLINWITVWLIHGYGQQQISAANQRFDRKPARRAA